MAKKVDISLQPYRTNSVKSEAVNFDKVVEFTFNGKSYFAAEGDSLSSALLANGVQLIGRSFKYHRRRGFMAAGVEEPNGLVQIGEGALTEPNCQAPMVEVYDGLVANSQNAYPSLQWDFMAINSWAQSILPSGFYYKTFMSPSKLWMTYEAVIREIAGLGKAPLERDPEHYDRRHAHCDILVVGGGIAGLMAAYVAALSGADVVVADEDNVWGGSAVYNKATIDGKSSVDWVKNIVAKLAEMPNVKMLKRTTVTGYYDYNFLTALERVSDHLPLEARKDKIRRRFWKIRATKVILAQGAIERPMVFGNNDLPGVMLASAVSEYLHRYRLLLGKKITIFTNNDSTYSMAFDLAAAGARVRIVEARVDIDESIKGKLAKAGIELHLSSVVIQAEGGKKLQKISIGRLSADGDSIVGHRQELVCDLLAVSGGLTPSVHLYSQAGGKLQYDDNFGIFTPNFNYPPANNDCYVIGGSNGKLTMQDALQDATQQATLAAKELSKDASAADIPQVKNDSHALTDIRLLWRVPSLPDMPKAGKAFVDWQNDVTADDIQLAHREGYQSVEHLKRYTTTGMGTDQGKTSNMNALALMAKYRKLPIQEVGTTTFRPPYTGLTFGAIAGRNRGELFIQKRTTPANEWHLKCGAVFEDVGDWKRPHYFPKDGEDMHQAVQREVFQVRRSVGMMDASTLGKIDIQGKDAVTLLNMLYTNAWDNLAIGRSRYGVMINEDGMIFDDGVTTRLGENHFHMTTTTGGAARVLNWLEEWLQTEWPDMQVHCTSVTEQWAVATITGPKARDLLSQVCDLDLSAEAFPFMSLQTAEVGGIPARIFRISFTGDLAYEINVPAGYGSDLWGLLLRHGKAHDLCLYGTEAMHVLRAEKGFIIVGQDTDGTVTPYDAGLDWLVSKKKEDFFGRRSFSRADTSRGDRKQLVGILTEDENFVIPEGAHIVETLKSRPPMDMLGHVTSSYYSPNCRRSIAMALVKDGFARRGQEYYVSLMDGTSHKVTIADDCNFYDSDGKRKDG